MRPLGASLRQLGSAVNVTFSKCELAQEPITRRLDEREPAVSKLERVLGQLPDAPPVLPSPGSHGEHVLDRRDASLVAEASVEPKALFPQSLGAVVLARQIRRSAVDPERLRAQLGRNRFRQVEQATEPAHALLGTGRVPDVLERDGDLETQLWVVLFRPIERGSEIVTFRQTRGDVRLHIVLAQVRRAGDREHPLRMPYANLVRLVRLLEPLRSELADRLEQPEPLVSDTFGPPAHEALVKQRRERVELGVANVLRRVERAAASEDGEAREEASLVLLEEVVRPRDRRAQGCMTFLGIARAAQEVEPVLEAFEQRFGGKELRAGSGKLECERQTIEPPAELGDDSASGDARPHRSRAFDEERNCLGFVERREVELVLPLDA